MAESIQQLDLEETCEGENLIVDNSLMQRTMNYVYFRRGMFVAFNAAIFSTLFHSLLKSSSMVISPSQVVVTIMPVVMMTSLVLIIYKGNQPPREIKKYIWFLPSGMSVAVMTVTNVLALRYMGIADVVTIIQLQVIFIGFLSWLILREPPRIIDLFFAVLAIVGVVVATRPTFIFGREEGDSNIHYDPLKGAAFALITASLIAVTAVVVRKQSRIGIHPYMSSLANAFQSAFINLIICLATQGWTCPSQMSLSTLVAAGLSYAMAQISIYVAYSLENATSVSIVSTSQIVIAFLWQFVFFRTKPLWTSLLGGTLVMVACIGSLVKRRKRVQNNRSAKETKS